MAAFRTHLCVFAAFLFVFPSSSFTYNGGVLVGYSYKTILVSDWDQCLIECVTDNRCLSYNFELKGFGNHSCELNNCAFKSRCEAEKVLIQTRGFVFHQLQHTKVKRVCKSRERSTDETPSTPPIQEIKLSVSCSQRALVYVDGVQKTQGIVTCPYNNSIDFLLTSKPKVIALEGTDDGRGQPGLVASLGNNLVTDSFWKCTPNTYTGWEGVDFNDSTWSNALVFCNNSNPIWPLRSVRGVGDKAGWIWCDEGNVNRRVYCRKKIDGSGGIQPFSPSSTEP